LPAINKFYLLCVIFSGSPDLTLKTCLVHFVVQHRITVTSGIAIYLRPDVVDMQKSGRDEHFEVQWSLYVPSGVIFNNIAFCPHSVFMCFVWISEQTAFISLYNIN